MGKPEYMSAVNQTCHTRLLCFWKAWLHFSRRMPLNKGPMGTREANYHVFAFKRKEFRSRPQCGVAPPRDDLRTRRIRPTLRRLQALELSRLSALTLVSYEANSYCATPSFAVAINYVAAIFIHILTTGIGSMGCY